MLLRWQIHKMPRPIWSIPPEPDSYYEEVDIHQLLGVNSRCLFNRWLCLCLLQLAIGYIAIHSLIPDLFSLLPYENAAYDFIAPQKWKHPNPPPLNHNNHSPNPSPKSPPPNPVDLYTFFCVHIYPPNILQPYIFSETLTHLKKRWDAIEWNRISKINPRM